MHKSLSETLYLTQSGVTVSTLGKVGIHTRVPASETDDAVAGVEVLDVIALTGRTNEGTGAASETGLRKGLPFGSVE